MAGIPSRCRKDRKRKEYSVTKKRREDAKAQQCKHTNYRLIKMINNPSLVTPSSIGNTNCNTNTI